MKTYRDLIIWQKAVDLVVKIYKGLEPLPNYEEFSLKSQMRRCSISIPSNIAEGFGRRSNKDFRRFIDIAIGSLFELQTQLEICKRLDYLSKEQFIVYIEQTREIERMIVAFRKTLCKN
jgi:four helix bundle protein